MRTEIEKGKGKGRMRILLVNDDGIDAEGMKSLAEMAVQLGEVWIAAPERQCSAMSHRLMLREEKKVVCRQDYAVAVEKAYSISGTPADCVKIALFELLPVKPDIVFSGVNYGWNAGFDIAYSGTIAAAVEARMNEIPAIAFSTQAVPCHDVMKKYLLPVTQDLLKREISDSEIWNVNFPGCPIEDYRGILYDRKVARAPLFTDGYYRTTFADGSFSVIEKDILTSEEDIPEGSDLKAVMEHYISIGKVRGIVF